MNNEQDPKKKYRVFTWYPLAELETYSELMTAIEADDEKERLRKEVPDAKHWVETEI